MRPNAGDLILVVSFGSGAGSDGFVFRTTKRLKSVQGLAERTRDMLDRNKRYVDYGTYLKHRKMIIMNE